ncbi:MAG: M3 family metallopeptidase [Myxococcota bacterium]|nr:M3 family metallopeptidase [Myxococcota bacterium]
MRSVKQRKFIAVIGVLVAGCCAAPPPAIDTPPPAPSETAPVEAPPPPAPEPDIAAWPAIWTTPADVVDTCKKHLDAAQKIRDALVSVSGPRTLENTLIPINDIFMELDAVLPRSSLFANVSPSKEVRDAAEKCQQDAMKFVSEFNLDRDVYNAILAVKTDGLDKNGQRFVTKLLRDYRRSGVDKDEATRTMLAGLNEEIVKVGQEYSRRVREDKRSIEVTKADLAGMPDDFMASHPPDDKGKIKITTDYPDYFPVVNHAESEAVRKAITQKFRARAHPENETTLKRLLALRHTYATTLGYEDWASYMAEDKMVKEKKVIADFIDQVADIARPRMKKDLKEVLKRKKKDNKKAKKVRAWDRLYYVNKIRAEKFGVDAQVVRNYFDYARVKEGVLAISQDLLGLTFERAMDAPVWHDSVEAYNVLENGEPIGRFYLDMHPRDNKYGHAAMMSVTTGVKGRQLPTPVLVCNFPKPSGNGPALMGHDQVTTFFHEFGHLMHHLLAGRQEWIEFSGVACEWDFVETPSQLMEEWAWDHDVLKQFAVHFETKAPIPAELVQKMRQADEFGKGLFVMRQMFFAALSFNYYENDPKDINLLKVLKKMQRVYNPFPYEKDTHVYSNFGHLVGYSSMYYTYMWSLVITKDVFTKFKATGLMDKDMALAYRKTILEPGGTVDAAEMVTNFLGRPYSFDAFKAWLEE